MSAPEHFEIVARLRKQHYELDYYLNGGEVQKKMLLEKLEKAKKDADNLEKERRMMSEMTLKLESEKLLLSQSLLQYGDNLRNINEKLAKASEQYERAAGERQSVTRKFASQLALSRRELDEVIGSLWRNHPNCSALMNKKNLLADLRHKYQSAKGEFQQREQNSQSQDCLENRPSEGTGDCPVQEPELVVDSNVCDEQNSPRCSKSLEKNDRNSPSQEPGIESGQWPLNQNFQKNGHSNQEDVVNVAMDSDPADCEPEHNSEEMRPTEGSSQERCTEFGPEDHPRGDNILNWTLPAPKESEATLQRVLQRSSVDHIPTNNGLVAEKMIPKGIHLAESTPLHFLQLDVTSKNAEKRHVPDITPIPSSTLSVSYTPPSRALLMNWRSPPPGMATQSQMDLPHSPPRELTGISTVAPNLSSFGDVLQKEAPSRNNPLILNENCFTPKLTPRLETRSDASTPPDRQIRPNVKPKEKRRLIFSPADKVVGSQDDDLASLPSNPKARRSESSFNSSFFNFNGQEQGESRGFFDSLFGPSATSRPFTESDDEPRFGQTDGNNFSLNFGKPGLGDDSGFSSAFGF